MNRKFFVYLCHESCVLCDEFLGFFFSKIGQCFRRHIPVYLFILVIIECIIATHFSCSLTHQTDKLIKCTVKKLKRKWNGALITHNPNNECFMYIVHCTLRTIRLMICSKQTYTIHFFLSSSFICSVFFLFSAYFFTVDAHRMASYYIAKLIVGILFIVIGSLNINRNNEQSAAIILNDVILIFIFFISIINVVISAFGIEHASKPLEKIH